MRSRNKGYGGLTKAQHKHVGWMLVKGTAKPNVGSYFSDPYTRHHPPHCF